MDREHLSQALLATTVANDQKQAGQFLDQLAKHQGFTPELLKIACDSNYSNAIRQAAVIYFKNTISKFWELDEDEEETAKEKFQLFPEDKELLKANILDAICISCDMTRAQLCVAAQQIIRTEFPEKWHTLLPSIQEKLSTPDGSALQGALLLVYRMSKIYEYKRAKERQPLADMMKAILPVINHHFVQLTTNDSQESVTIQKLILKIIYSLVQFSLNFEMVPVEMLNNWIELSRQVLLRPVPEEINQIEDFEERGHTVWWKCKKWAAKLLDRIFERYGAPGQVESDYAEFAKHFLENFSIPCVEVMLQILNNKRQNIFVTDRVLLLSLSFVNTSVAHSHCWRVIKPHAQNIITTVIFPLLCHSDDDEEKWEDDVEEFIRFKFDIFEDMHNPSYGAGSLLVSMCKRKGIVHPVLAFAIGILGSSQDPRQIDGALRLLGELSETLCKSKNYKKDVEKLLDAHVINRLTNDPSRFVRARAAWCVKEYSETVFSSNKIPKKIVQGLVQVLNNPQEELPAKVEAALAIENLLDEQEHAHDLIKPYVTDVIPRVLELAAKTQIEETVSVMDKLMDEYIDEVVPIAANIAEHMTTMFLQVAGSEVADERTPALMSIISTLSNVVDVVSDHREIMVQIEGHVLKIINFVFETANYEFYDEVLMLIQSLIAVYVSEPLWNVFDLIYQMVKTDNGTMFPFSDVVPALHLYIVTDTESFLARPDRLNAIIDMCKGVLENNEQGDENQLHAAKLLEVVVLQCAGMINDAIPAILVIALERLTKPFEDGLVELKHMLLLVAVAALYTNTELALKILKELAPNHPNPLDYLTQQLAEMSEKFEGVHNRRMAVFAWCTLIQLPAELRPSLFQYDPKKVIQCCLSIFKGLRRALNAQAEMRKAELESDEEDSDDDEDHRNIDDDLSDDDDHIDDMTLDYLNSLSKENKRALKQTEAGDQQAETQDSDSDSDYSFDDEAETEQFTVNIDDENAPDVFVLFKRSLENFQVQEQIIFHQMVNTLSEQERADLEELDKICDNHIKAETSRKTLEAGGFSFQSDAVVPGNFNFGS